MSALFQSVCCHTGLTAWFSNAFPCFLFFYKRCHCHRKTETLAEHTPFSLFYFANCHCLVAQKNSNSEEMCTHFVYMQHFIKESPLRHNHKSTEKDMHSVTWEWICVGMHLRLNATFSESKRSWTAWDLVWVICMLLTYRSVCLWWPGFFPALGWCSRGTFVMGLVLEPQGQVSESPVKNH